MEAEAGGTGGEAGRPKRSSDERGLWFGVVAVLLVAIAGVYVWKLVAVSDVRSEMAARRDSLLADSRQELEERTEELLRLSGVPLAWALRPELIRRNYDQVNAYTSEFVQEPGIERVVLGTPADSILVATDKRLEGRAFTSVLPAELLEIRNPRVERLDGEIRLSVPVLGPTRALGILVVSYRPAGDGPGQTTAGARGR